MTTQAQAPTEEMRERAWLVCKDVIQKWTPAFQDGIAQALAAQDRLAVERERERCASVTIDLPLTPKFSKHDTKGSAFYLGAGAAISAYRAALRAQGEK